MPLTLSQLLAPTAESDMPYAGDSLHLTWRPGGMTPATIARILEVEDKPLTQQLPVLIDVLLETIAGWDLLGDDGEPLPLTADQLAGLPSQFLWELHAFLRSESAPKAPTGAHSGGSSGQAATSARHRRGSGSSVQPRA